MKSYGHSGTMARWRSPCGIRTAVEKRSRLYYKDKPCLQISSLASPSDNLPNTHVPCISPPVTSPIASCAFMWSFRMSTIGALFPHMTVNMWYGALEGHRRTLYINSQTWTTIGLDSNCSICWRPLVIAGPVDNLRSFCFTVMARCITGPLITAT